MTRITLLFCLLCSLQGMVAAQDLHQTDYRLNPLLINPAKSGSFYGTGRIGVVYRDQFRPFIQQAFQTPVLFVDSPIMTGLKPNHWIGIGMMLYSDKAGDLGYSTVGSHLSGAYHIGLDKDMYNVLTIGLRYGQVTKSVKDGMMAIFGDELADPALSSPDQTFVDNLSVSYSDLALGFMYTSTLNDRSGIQLGGSVDHLAVSSKAKGLVHFRLNAHATYSFDYTNRIRIEPTLYYYGEKSSSVFNPQLNTAYHLNPNKSLWLKAGLGYRSGDALQILLGAEFSDWTIGLAYDLTISEAAGPTNNIGAIEIGINKIIKIYKEPEVDPIIFCPRF